MADGATTVSIWPVLWPVIIGGLLALAGSTIGPLFTLWWTKRESEQKLRTERFEELLAALYSHDHWLDQKRRARVGGNPEEHTQPPLYRAISIASLYFPEFVRPLKELDVAGDQYQLWMMGALRKRLDGEEITSVGDGFNAAYVPYREALSAFHRRAAEYAKARKGRV